MNEMINSPTYTCIVEIVNCYCFNPKCSTSIFNLDSCIAIEMDIDQVMAGDAYCERCNSELLARPALKMKNEIYKSFGSFIKSGGDKCKVAISNINVCLPLVNDVGNNL